jgi:large subunit ribosomal protein L11
MDIIVPVEAGLGMNVAAGDCKSTKSFASPRLAVRMSSPGGKAKKVLSSGSKAVKQRLKMLLPAGKAAPGPPVGPRLGQVGLNIMQFCKEFNQSTAALEEGVPIPTLITAYTDRSFTFETRQPPVSFFLRRLAGVEKGSSTPGRTFVGEPVTLTAVYELARIKQQDSNLRYSSMQSLCKSIMGTARSMGIRIIDDRDLAQTSQSTRPRPDHGTLTEK